MKGILTTPEVARIFGVQHGTVIQWIINGHLEGSRMGKGPYLIPKKSAAALASRCGVSELMPGDGIAALVRDGMARALGKDSRIMLAGSWFHLARLLAEYRPDGLVLDLSIGRELAVQAVKLIRSDKDRPMVIALCPEDEDGLPNTELWDRKITPPWGKVKAELDGCRRVWNIARQSRSEKWRQTRKERTA